MKPFVGKKSQPVLPTQLHIKTVSPQDGGLTLPVISDILRRYKVHSKGDYAVTLKSQKLKRFDSRDGFQRNVREEEGRRYLLWRKVTG